MRIRKIKTVTLAIFLLFNLNGCHIKNEIQDNVKSNKEVVQTIHKEEKIETVPDNKVAVAQKDSQSSFESDVQGEEDQDLKDYEKLIRKIWILEEGETVGDYRYSFVFTKIEDDKIDGRLRTGTNITSSFTSPDIYEESTKSFAGSINNGKAICNLADKTGNIGTITFQFYENDKIEAKLDYVKMVDEWDVKDTEKSYLFRPYTIQDYSKRMLIVSTEKDSYGEVEAQFIIDEREEVSISTELESYGKVKFVSGVVADILTSYPVVFITNNKDEIYYKIHLTNGFEVMEVIVEDSNGDGLKDIIIILYSPDVPEAFKPIWVFNQTKDGMFYKDESDKRYMNPED